MRAPDIGDLFWHRDHHFRVNAWLCPAVPVEPPADERSRMRDLLNDILFDTQQLCGPDRVRLRFCTQAEAVYVSGVGPCGCIVRVSDVTIVGRVPWPEHQLIDARDTAERLAGTPVY